MIAVVPFQTDEEYAVIESEVGQRYPVLQLSNSKPKATEKTSFVLAEKSYKMLSADALKKLGAIETAVYFGNSDKPEDCMEITADFRLVFWGIPAIFYAPKGQSNKYDQMREKKGKMEKGEMTVSRILVSFVVNNEIVKKDDDTPQFFTFKLTSFGTDLMAKRLPELRDVIKKAANCNNSLLHLVHCGIALSPVLRKSKETTESSWAVDLNIVDYIPFPKAEHANLFSIASSEEVRSFMQDPFYLQQRQEQSSAQEVSDRKSVLDSILAAATTIGFVDADDRKNFLQSFVQDRFGKNNSSELTFDELNIMSDELCERAMAGVTTGIEF